MAFLGRSITTTPKTAQSACTRCACSVSSESMSCIDGTETVVHSSLWVTLSSSASSGGQLRSAVHMWIIAGAGSATSNRQDLRSKSICLKLTES